MQATQEGPRDGSGAMFDRIAGRYDLLNRLISLGIDQGWRRATVASLSLRDGDRVLDVATGTADLALQIAEKYPAVRVVGLDPSRGMLDVGAQKVARAGLDGRVTLEQGDAQSMGFDEGSFDAACMAFGIRNVPDRPAALRELARVVRPGGRVAILELAEPREGVLSGLARFHVHRVVPFVGGLLSGSHEYAYLQRSIAAFPPAEEFARVMGSCGLRVLEARALTFGVATLYVAESSRGH